MFRILVPSILYVLAAGFLTSAGAVPIEVEKKPLTSAQELQIKLTQRVKLEGFEPNTPLWQAASFLTERYGIPIHIDGRSFGQPRSGLQPENLTLKLPMIVNMRLSDAVDLTAEACDGAIVQCGDQLWIVHKDKARAFALRQKVDAAWKGVPLSAVLQDLSAQTGQNVVLDAKRVGKAGETPITVSFNRESFETAVTLVADVAELEVVDRGNSLFVTTPAHAEKLRKPSK